MDKKEIKTMDNHLYQQRKELGIETFRGEKKEKGTITLFNNDLSKCTICEAPTKTLVFLNKYGQGSSITVCKECLKKAIEVL